MNRAWPNFGALGTGARSLIMTLTALMTLSGVFVQSNPACPELKEGMTNVHLVCHTHDDVGWLKTVDQYYYGSNKDVTGVGVQYILDSVVDSLLKDPSRKFIYVESAFFYRWWNQQNEQMKNTVSGLVESGQLEFVGGGWSMNDEAATHYNAIIDQMTLGLAKLNETFGPASFPRIAWQIDPFGHSKEQASLFAQMGMDGLFFARLDHADKSNRWDSKEMEMVWKGSNSLGEESWIFTGALANHYSPPSGFCFDYLCHDDPIMDDPNLEDYNIEEMVNSFLQAVADQQEGFLSSNLMMMMGDDFHYTYAEAWYKNLDKLIRYVNERQLNGSNVNVFYSTPSCYVDALNQANLTWPTKTDDFFPYSSNDHEYWTGYFTSRPTLKYFTRYSNNILQAAKQLAAISDMGRGPWVNQLAEAMGIEQHHDAITGTAKQYVTDDYSSRLDIGVSASTEALKHGIRYLNDKKGSKTSEENRVELGEGVFCPLLNISACSFTEEEASFVVNVYNPLSRTRSSFVRIPVAEGTQEFTVTNEIGEELETQVINLPEAVLNIPGRESTATRELVFLAENLPPLGTEQFLVEPKSTLESSSTFRPVQLNSNEDILLEKGVLRLTLDGETHKIKSLGVVNGQRASAEQNMTQEWLWYEGYGNSESGSSGDNSGAYLFRPVGDPHLIGESANRTVIYEGPLVTEVQQEWNSWVSQILRLYKNKTFVEVEWLVGPIPVDDDVGKEVIARYRWPEMETNDTFFTDANGREMQTRVKDKRETWDLVTTEPVSQNYYPVTSKIILSSFNDMGRAVVLNDRSQGGTSLSDGEIELMVHRRLRADDAKGVGEALDEVAFGTGLVVRGRHFFLHSDSSTTECDFGCQHRTLGEEILLGPILTFSLPSSFIPRPKNVGKIGGLAKELPANLRVLTLEPFSESDSKKWLLRIENFYEAGESSLSAEVAFDLRDMFTDWDIVNIEELTLGANMAKEDNERLQWNTRDGALRTPAKESPQPLYLFSPMQIRTFLLQVAEK